MSSPVRYGFSPSQGICSLTLICPFFPSVVEPKEDSPSSLVAAGMPVSEARNATEIPAPQQAAAPVQQQAPVEVAAPAEAVSAEGW